MGTRDNQNQTNRALYHPSLKQNEILDLAILSGKAYEDSPNLSNANLSAKMTSIIKKPKTKEDALTGLLKYGLDPKFVRGNTFVNKYKLPDKNSPDFLETVRKLVSQGPGQITMQMALDKLNTIPEANAQVFLREDRTLIVVFRGTDINKWDMLHWFSRENHYNLFKPLFDAVDRYVRAEKISNVQVTGHSLGASMAERYMAKHKDGMVGEKNNGVKGNINYSGVTLAPPDASLNPNDTRILNINNETDIVGRVANTDNGWISGKQNVLNTTSNIAVVYDTPSASKTQNPKVFVESIVENIIKKHSPETYIKAIETIQDANKNSNPQYRINTDEPTVIERTNNERSPGEALRELVRQQMRNNPKRFTDTRNPRMNTHIFGEERNDRILELPNSERMNPFSTVKINNHARGEGGNDEITVSQGSIFDSLHHFGGDDILDGGSGNDILGANAGNDRLVGGEGIDTAIFSGKSSEYTIEAIEGTTQLKVTHKGGKGYDGVDILESIEFAKFKNETVDIRNKYLQPNSTNQFSPSLPKPTSQNTSVLDPSQRSISQTISNSSRINSL